MGDRERERYLCIKYLLTYCTGAGAQEEQTTNNMKHLAAYLLLVLGGNDSPTAKDIKNLLDSVGIEADDDRIKKLLGEVKGKDLNEVCVFFPPHLQKGAEEWVAVR